MLGILAVEAKHMRAIRSLAKIEGSEWIIKIPVKGDRLEDALHEASEVEEDIKFRAEMVEHEKKYGKML